MRYLASIAATLLSGFALCTCSGEQQPRDEMPTTLVTVPAEIRDIVVTASATGVVVPVERIEIKSKASGKILHVPVETGDEVVAGALLAQVDSNEVAAALRQAMAELRYARARFAIALRQRGRADTLFTSGMISEDAHDEAVLGHVRAEAEFIAAETIVERARERLDDTVVRAPSAGTILTTSVARGQIIASATGQVSGGTLLMTMADLDIVQVRALIIENDLGRIQPGLRARVVAEAYPNRTFDAHVEKMEPEGIEKDHTTYFAAILRIDNRDGLLLPGMGCDITIDIERKNGILTLASDAITLPEDAANVARLLGVEAPESLGDASETSGVVFLVNRDESPLTIRPVVVQLGLQEWDYTEIVDGLSSGDEALIPPSSQVAERFREYRELARKYGSLPGRR